MGTMTSFVLKIVFAIKYIALELVIHQSLTSSCAPRHNFELFTKMLGCSKRLMLLGEMDFFVLFGVEYP